MVAPACLLGIDWGTSRRRAYLIDAQGQCLRRFEDAHGALSARGHFAESLQALQQQLEVDALVPVVMSGMVGSAMGWQEVAYLDNSVALARLPETLVPVSGAPGCHIVPGYCYRDHGRVDVMRGEETQVLGALLLGHGDGCYVLPGTHSKWVEVVNGAIASLTTFITGELFAALRTSGTLAPLMAEGGDDNAALRAGANRAQDALALTHTLFEARARVVSGESQAGQTRSYVSGLLIGTEFAGSSPGAQNAATIRLIGSSELSGSYREVAQLLGYRTELIDPDQAYCAALARFMEAL